VSWAILPEGQSLDEIEDDEEPRSGSARRRAHATRLVETVVTTLTARQQQVYQLRYVGELTGRQVAEQLGISDKTASNEITRVQDLIATGFGALILLQEGRRYCPDLAAIIENAPDEVGTTAFTTALRERIVRHFDNCNICDDCRTCNTKRRELVGPYVPAVIPILFAADLHDRITEMIDRITRQADPDPHSHHPGFGPPADADAILTARETGGPGSAGGAGPAAVLLAFAADLHDRITEMIDRITRQAETGGPGSAGGAGRPQSFWLLRRNWSGAAAHGCIARCADVRWHQQASQCLL
jgi:DNA-binding CsgD family transcriptional regulator